MNRPPQSARVRDGSVALVAFGGNAILRAGRVRIGQGFPPAGQDQPPAGQRVHFHTTGQTGFPRQLDQFPGSESATDGKQSVGKREAPAQEKTRKNGIPRVAPSATQ